MPEPFLAAVYLLVALGAVIALAWFDRVFARRYSHERVVQYRPGWWWQMFIATGYVRVGSRWQVLLPKDTAALEFLREVVERQRSRGAPLLHFREQFRELERLPASRAARPRRA